MFVGNVHIARGNEEDLPALLILLAKEEGIPQGSNADLYVRSYSTFGIDEARDLSERAATSAVVMERRVFVIVAHAITHEAQNALLKTLEEAPGNALFLFLHPAPETLLPTVRSRAQRLDLPPAAHTDVLIDAEMFLKAAPAKRLDMLKPLLEKDDDDKRDLGAILSFLGSLERALAARMAESSARQGLQAVLRAERFLADRGALVKPLLEQVALLI
jgi:hypothetical protein